MNNIYYESSLFTNFIYPRYFSELQRFSFIPNVVYDESYIAINKDDELWAQFSKYDNNLNMIVPDNDVPVKNTQGNILYISQTPHYFSKKVDGGGNHFIVYYLDKLLNSEEVFVRLSCGTYIGNTNTNERIQQQKPVDVSNDLKNATLDYKRIWGFEPDNVIDSIEDGIIDGFSKKKYAVFIITENSKTKYIPTVKGAPLTDNDIQTIVNDKPSYGDYYDEHESLIVSD